MARLCERPGCNREAAVIFGFQADDLLVWLDAVRPDQIERARAGVLCVEHADAMRVPRGWTLDDRREAAPRLFRTAEAPTGEHRRPSRRPSRAHADDTGPMPTLFDQPADAPAAAEEPPEATPAPEAEPEPVTPWRPVFDNSDDLGGLLNADSPLLARAFRGRTPRRDEDHH